MDMDETSRDPPSGLLHLVKDELVMTVKLITLLQDASVVKQQTLSACH